MLKLYFETCHFMNTSQVVPAQSRTRDKTYPDFLTSKSYPVFTEVYHLVPADQSYPSEF